MASFHLPLQSYEMLWLFMCCLSTTSTGQHCLPVSKYGKLIYACLLIRKQRAPAPGSLACSRRLDSGDNANRCIFPALLTRTALHATVWMPGTGYCGSHGLHSAWQLVHAPSKSHHIVTTQVWVPRKHYFSSRTIFLRLQSYARLLLQSRKEQENHTKKSTNETAGNKPVKNVWLWCVWTNHYLLYIF